MANGMRNQTGSRVVSAPIGSPAIAALRSLDEPASSTPKITRMTGAIAPPKVVQPMTPRALERARQVARVVGGGVDPAEPESGHQQHERADHRADARRQGIAITASRLIFGATRIRYSTVATPVTIVMTTCSRMIRVKP